MRVCAGSSEKLAKACTTMQCVRLVTTCPSFLPLPIGNTAQLLANSAITMTRLIKISKFHFQPSGFPQLNCRSAGLHISELVATVAKLALELLEVAKPQFLQKPAPNLPSKTCPWTHPRVLCKNVACQMLLLHTLWQLGTEAFSQSTACACGHWAFPAV